jgi:pimeloyl-ACP methyl ester carboxylesterase
MSRLIVPRATLAVAASLILLICSSAASRAQDVAVQIADKRTDWHGFDRYHFSIAQRPAYIVVPKTAATGKPWIWRARFPDFHFEMDVELLKQGFHVAYIDVAGLFGSPQAMEIGDAFYDDVTQHRGLAKRPALEGVSRGGLFVYNWAARHPERVACIYCDTPVLDFKSWPGGKGTGIGSAGTWQQCLKVYGLTEAAALGYKSLPLNHAAVIAKHNIPLLHIVSESDTVVPPVENTYELQKRLKELNHELPVISVPQGTEKSHGHHFTHPDPERVVNFIAKHAK